MIYTNKQELLQLLNKHNLYADKSLGQNFLINPEIIKQIIKASEIKPIDNIVEIGPGLGILTNELLKHANKVHAIELDRNIIKYLEKTFSNNPKFELEKGNALKAQLPQEPYKLIANIPYYITSPILSHFLQPSTEPRKAGRTSTFSRQLRPTLIVLLVQKEVAEKICAKQGDHNVLSLQTQIFGKPEIVANVGANNIYPAPKVESAILKITTYPEPLIKNTHNFIELIKACFSQKRKTIANTIANKTKIPKSEIEEKLITLNINPKERPQNLSIEQWKELIKD